MTPKQQTMVENMEKEKNSRSGIFRKAFSRESRSNAVKAKCLDCCSFIITEITECNVETCPLWPYRPYQKKITP